VNGDVVVTQRHSLVSMAMILQQFSAAPVRDKENPSADDADGRRSLSYEAFLTPDRSSKPTSEAS
jgi:hypothetical protein